MRDGRNQRAGFTLIEIMAVVLIIGLLSGIVGHTELLKRVAEEDPASVAGSEHLQTIEKASLDGATLVRRIQQYIRQDSRT